MAVDLVTPEELDAYLSGDRNASLAAAMAAVRSYCGWHVAPVETHTVTIRAEGEGVLLLPSLHVVSVDSVEVDGEPVTDYSWREHGTLRTTSRCCMSTHLWGHRHEGGGWCGKVEVAFTHGFDEADDVKGIVLAAAARMASSPAGVVRAQTGQVSETYTQTSPNQAGGMALLDSERAVLDRYRLPARP